MATIQERHPEQFRVRDDDPMQRKRTVPMEVLSLGYSRTGTMSMCAALETLGIKPFHYVNMPENPLDIAAWGDALEAKFHPTPHTPPLDRAHFDRLLGHWGACTDQPACIFAPELVASYPEAKVVLVERDVDNWFDSFDRTVVYGFNSAFIPLLETVDRTFIGQQARAMDLINYNYFGVKEKRAKWLFNRPGYFEEWRSKAKGTYLAHNACVKRVTPKERLLCFKLEEGWGPLCEFLGKEVPDLPFPRVNETAALREKIEVMLMGGYKRAFWGFVGRATPVVMVGVAVGAWWWTR